MCRIFASRSHRPASSERTLLAAENSLRFQSREHSDGWGLAWYEEGLPRVIRSLSAAHADDQFARVTKQLKASTLVAHVRQASVGEVSLDNTHPFQHGRWVFVHNGTVPEWDTARPLLEEQIDPQRRKILRGETDSERCFALFLSKLARKCDLDAASFDHAAAALRETVAAVREASEPSPEGKASTTFLVTDGRLLIACRRGRTLHLHVPPVDDEGRVAWFAVASEHPGKVPKSFAEEGAERSPPWRAVDEDAWVGVDASLRLHRGWL